MRYRYRTDEEMKDSGVEWIGKIPKDYKLEPLKKYFSFEKGKNAGLYTSEYIGKNKGEYPVYSGQTENEGVMGRIDRYEYDLEECLFTTTVGAKVMTVSYLTGKFTLSQNCLIMINNINDICTKYIYYYLQELFRYEKSSIPSYMQPSLRIEDLKKYRILTTSHIEQEKIANFLDEKTSQFDFIISKKEELIKKLEEAKKSLISEVVTGKVKVVKTDDGYELVKRKKDEMKDSGIEWLGEIPKEWEIYRSKYLWKKEKRPILDNYDVVTAFRDGEVTLRTNRRTEGYTFAIKETGYQGVLKGDLVISAMDAFAGAMGISDSEGKCSPVYSVCSPIKKLVPDYYKYLLKEMSQKGYILSLAKGIRERSTDFRYSEFANTTLLYPNFNEQEIISSYINIKLNNIDEFKTKIKCQIEKLKEAKQSLISEVVTGKIEILD